MNSKYINSQNKNQYNEEKENNLNFNGQNENDELNYNKMENILTLKIKILTKQWKWRNKIFFSSDNQNNNFKSQENIYNEGKG